MSYTTSDSASVTSVYENTLRQEPYKSRLIGDARDLLTESTVMMAPIYIAGSYYVVPMDISIEADYKFYIYVTSHGDPYGRELTSSMFTLIVGCTSSITVTNSASFNTATVYVEVADPLTSIYQFFEPIIDIRSTYC